MASSGPYFICHLLLLLLLGVLDIVASQWIIKNLPGFPGQLPFKLESGYVGVGKLDEIQLFYYFIESETSPEDDPLVLWLAGGPGCSSFSGLAYEIGPLAFDSDNSNWSTTSPTLRLNPYSWTNVANIIFVDSPVGTGFSYATNWEAYNTSDTLSATTTYHFLRKWLMAHPKFLKNPLYIAGCSYSGIVVPVVVQEITNGNEVGLQPSMNLKGYVLGNPFTTPLDENARIPFSHRMALISDKLYKSAKTNCKGNFVNIDPENALCVNDMKVINECLNKIQSFHVLEPWCPDQSFLNPMGLKGYQSSDLFTEKYSIDISFLSLPNQLQWCRAYIYISSLIWANVQNVQNALHIRKGSIEKWVRCNKSLSYTQNIQSSFDYHQSFVDKNYRSLIYSGDHDMVVPYLSTHAWIEALNLTIAVDWKPWFVDEQIAGYTMQYTDKNYQLTFATVKGAGHTAPESKPKECLGMIERWLANYPL